MAAGDQGDGGLETVQRQPVLRRAAEQSQQDGQVIGAGP
jgi:hypothetical protein